MTDRHPYALLLDAEAKRAEEDLSSMRSRALSIVTTASGIVTLLTALTTFAASKAENERGLSGRAVWLLGFALGLFVAAAVLALWANRPGDIRRPKVTELTATARWNEKDSSGQPDTADQERVAAEVLAEYVVSVRKLSDRAAMYLNLSIWALIAGLAFASIAAVVLLRNF
jgi:disulfide bond formation protein DsbB